MSVFCYPLECSPPGSSVLGMFQARILQWVAISFSRGSSWARDQTQVSCNAGRFFTDWATREAGVKLVIVAWIEVRAEHGCVLFKGEKCMCTNGQMTRITGRLVYNFPFPLHALSEHILFFFMSVYLAIINVCIYGQLYPRTVIYPLFQ